MTSTPGSAERRDCPRRRCSRPISYRAADGEWADGEARDVGRGGLLVVCERSFDVGEVVEFYLRRGDMETALMLTARVVHVRCLAAGKWLLGCKVRPHLSAAEVDGILRDAGQAPPAPE